MKPNPSLTEHIIELAGETLHVHPQRALYRPAARALLIADLHLGKDSVFNRHGIAIPAGATRSSLQRLSALVAHYSPERLIVLGDFMHAAPRPGDTWPGDLSEWLDAHVGIEVQVVAGNHDTAAGRASLDPRLRWQDTLLPDPPFAYAHAPCDHPSLYVLAGHLHPVYRLVSATDRVRCPVLWLRRDHAVLPAFGAFTGGAHIRPAAGENLLLFGPDDILPLTAPQC